MSLATLARPRAACEREPVEVADDPVTLAVAGDAERARIHTMAIDSALGEALAVGSAADATVTLEEAIDTNRTAAADAPAPGALARGEAAEMLLAEQLQNPTVQKASG